MSGRKRIVKIDAFTRASWYIGHGFPPAWVAEKLGISRTTLWSWRQLMNHNETFKELRRRVLLLPAALRDQLATSIQDARRAA